MMDSLSVWLLNAIFLILWTDLSIADEVCVEDGRVYTCKYRCCSVGSHDYCCLSPYQIAGIVFGCICVICIIAALVCLCKKHKNERTRIANQPAVFVVNNNPTTTMTRYPNYYPYSSHPGAFATTYSNPAYPPPTAAAPPPYSLYNNTPDKHRNPFSVAAAAASDGSNPGTSG